MKQSGGHVTFYEEVGRFDRHGVVVTITPIMKLLIGKTLLIIILTGTTDLIAKPVGLTDS